MCNIYSLILYFYVQLSLSLVTQAVVESSRQFVTQKVVCPLTKRLDFGQTFVKLVEGDTRRPRRIKRGSTVTFSNPIEIKKSQ